jgi:hypothetical protein
VRPLIALSRSEENVDRFNRALAEMGVFGEPQYGQFGTAFETRHGRLEVVRKADGIGGYEDWLRRATEEDFGEGLVIVVAAGEDILSSKQAAGRAKDEAVLQQMREDLGGSG